MPFRRPRAVSAQVHLFEYGVDLFSGRQLHSVKFCYFAYAVSMLHMTADNQTHTAVAVDERGAVCKV